RREDTEPRHGTGGPARPRRPRPLAQCGCQGETDSGRRARGVSRTGGSPAKQNRTDPASPGTRSARREMPTLLGADPGARGVMKPFIVSIVVLVGAAALLGAYPATAGADPTVPVPFKGRAEYTLTAVEPDGTLRYIGTGHATHLGLFTADASLFPHGDGTFSVTAVFTAANGDQLFFIGGGGCSFAYSRLGTATLTVG